MTQQQLHDFITDVIYNADLPPEELLPVLAQILGHCVSLQDRSKFTPEQVYSRVADNMQRGAFVNTNMGMLN